MLLNLFLAIRSCASLRLAPNLMVLGKGLLTYTFFILWKSTGPSTVRYCNLFLTFFRGFPRRVGWWWTSSTLRYWNNQNSAPFRGIHYLRFFFPHSADTLLISIGSSQCVSTQGFLSSFNVFREHLRIKPMAFSSYLLKVLVRFSDHIFSDNRLSFQLYTMKKWLIL